MQILHFFYKKHLEDGEEIMHVAHKSWVTVKKDLFLSIFVGLILPIILSLVFPKIILIWLAWLVIGFLRLVYALFNWLLDAWLVTNQGVLGVRWDGFFNRKTKRLEYKSIEGVEHEVDNFWATIFSYGTILIQQPGGEVRIRYIHRPKLLASKIAAHRVKFIEQQKWQDEETLKDILSGMIQRQGKEKGEK